MIKIGVIGTGGIGQAFAKHAVKAGYEILLSNSRGPESISGFVSSLDGNVRAVTIDEALNADLIFLSVPWNQIKEVAGKADSWKGKIVIDPSNPIIMPGFQTADLNGELSSEVVAALLPGAFLVKAFNTLPKDKLAMDPQEAGGRRVIFYSGNDPASKTVVAEIINNIGFAGIDLGKINEGGKLQHYPDGKLLNHDLIFLM
jgi:predicted dinucleotide-binding enzyme